MDFLINIASSWFYVKIDVLFLFSFYFIRNSKTLILWFNDKMEKWIKAIFPFRLAIHSNSLNNPHLTNSNLPSTLLSFSIYPKAIEKNIFHDYVHALNFTSFNFLPFYFSFLSFYTLHSKCQLCITRCTSVMMKRRKNKVCVLHKEQSEKDNNAGVKSKNASFALTSTPVKLEYDEFLIIQLDFTFWTLETKQNLSPLNNLFLWFSSITILYRYMKLWVCLSFYNLSQITP